MNRKKQHSDHVEQSRISDLLNLGPVSEGMLAKAGIRSIEQIRAMGAVTAFRLVKDHSPKASLNLLWAMATGLEGRHWTSLTVEEKAALKSELALFEQ
ncbi:MAG: TfoX/Sxy family protein [Pirellulaceae bacterium]